MTEIDVTLAFGLLVLLVSCVMLTVMLQRAHKTIEQATVTLNLAVKLSMRGHARSTTRRDFAA